MATSSFFSRCVLVCYFLFCLSEGLDLDCSKPFKLGDQTYDFKDLQHNVTLKSNVTTKPTITEFQYQINPCGFLTLNTTIDKNDQCDSETLVCETIRNYKEAPRITQVIAFGKSNSTISAIQDGTESKLLWSSKGEKIDDQQKTCRIEFFCSENDTPPKMDSLSDGVLSFKWHTKSACPVSGEKPKPKPEDPKKPEDPPETSPASGGSIFGFIILASIMFYLIGGMVYNHYVYNLRGIYLIPHLSFWREFPDLFMSFVHHMVSMVSGRRRNSYNRV